KYFDFWRMPAARRGNQVRYPVPRDVPGRNMHPAGERRVIGRYVEAQVARVPVIGSDLGRVARTHKDGRPGQRARVRHEALFHRLQAQFYRRPWLRAARAEQPGEPFTKTNEFAEHGERGRETGGAAH